ncbi:MAG: PKD domain-containing protein [Thermoplasmata archaeon]
MRHRPVPIVVAIAILAVASLVAPSGSVFGSSQTAAPRVAETPIATPASTSIRVAPGYAAPSGVETLGPLFPSTPLDVAVGLASHDPTGLAALVDAQSVPGTPTYRAYLPASEAASRFGATASAIQTATRYFESYGLTVASSPDGLILDVQGASASIARAFGTSFDEYRSPAGRTYVSHPTPAALPSIAPWIGVLGLGNVTSMVPSVTPEAPGAAPAAGCTPGVDLTPCDLHVAYSLNPLLANGTNGSGVRIAVVDAYSGDEPADRLKSDFSNFANDTGLAAGNITFRYPDPTTIDLNSTGTNTGWPLEDALDVEWSRAMAPGASIEMTYSPDAGPGLYAAIDWLVGGGRADVISLSWGEPDVGIYNAYQPPVCQTECNASTDGSYAVLSPVLELAAAEGISVFAASGDCGAADGTSGLSTNYPASDPYVTGVGGTYLSIDTNGTYRSEWAWNGSEAGSSAPGCINSGGSGGGYSPFPTPWWQVGLGFSGPNRGAPDVSADASDPVEIYAGGGLSGVEGTSVATPVWAGIAADADQYAKVDLGFLNPSLYRILNSSNYSSDFHDILLGNNDYAAGHGWDAVTGIGTPIVSALVRNLVSTSGAGVSNLSTTVTASPTSGSAPLTTTLNLTATGGSGVYPLEGISFGDGNASLFPGGSTDYTFAQAGVYEVQSFVFDSVGNEAVSPAAVVIVGGGVRLSVQLAASNATPTTGAVVNFTATVTGGTAPYSYDFFFGDGSSITGNRSHVAVHAYPAAGVYRAEVAVHDSASPTDGGASSAVNITVQTPTPFTILANTTEGVRDAAADFPALFVTRGSGPGSGHPTTTTLGSADPYTKACGCTVFRTAGTYNVSEWINDSSGILATANATVTVAPPLNVTFTSSTQAGPAPLTVVFSSAVVSGGFGADAATTGWRFGNGSGAVGQSVTAVYSTPGEYVAIGSLSDLGHGNASEAFVVDVEPAHGAVPVGVTATISPAVNVSSGTTLTVTAGLIGPAGEIVFWSLGDGHSAYGPLVEETYFGPLPPADSNTLSASFDVEDSYLNTLLTVPITLPRFFATEPGGFLPGVDTLTLSTDVRPGLGVVPFNVSVNGNSTGPGGATLEWRFGDGNSSILEATTHSYRIPGGYTLEGYATDALGDRATSDTAIVASAPFGVVAGPNTGSGEAPLTVTFSASAYGGNGPPYGYNWSLPDGKTVGGPVMALTLSSGGTYTVTLNVTDRAGTLIQRSWTVSVTSAPVLTFAEIVAISTGVGILAAVLGTGAWRRKRKPIP